jgi:hypothetical protein
MEYSLPVLMLIHSKPAVIPSYPEVCIPPYPPDLNCGDISDRRFAVLPPDPHGFDWNNDGIGCEIGGEPTGGLLPQGTVQCGQVVQEIVTLTANLTCSGDVNGILLLTRTES